MGRDAAGFISTEELESSSDEDESLSVELSLVVLLLRFVSKTPSPRFISMYSSSSSSTFSTFTSSRLFWARASLDAWMAGRKDWTRARSSVGGATGCVLRSEMFRMSCGSVDTFVLDEASFNLSRRDRSLLCRWSSSSTSSKVGFDCDISSQYCDTGEKLFRESLESRSSLQHIRIVSSQALED